MDKKIKLVNEGKKFFMEYKDLWFQEPYKSCLTSIEKDIYCLLADRHNQFVKYDQTEKFIDIDGKFFIVYRQEDLADDVGKAPKFVGQCVKKLRQFNLIDYRNTQKPEKKVEEINFYYICDIPDPKEIDAELVQEILDKKKEFSEIQKKKGSKGGNASAAKRKLSSLSNQNNPIEQVDSEDQIFKQSASEIEAKCFKFSSKLPQYIYYTYRY